MRIHILTLAAVALSLLTVPIGTAVPQTAPSYEASVTDSQELADDLLTGSPSEVMHQIATEAGQAPTEVSLDEANEATAILAAEGTDGTLTTDQIEAALEALPTGLDEPVTRLVGALATAYQLHQMALEDLSEEEAALLADHAHLVANKQLTPSMTTATSNQDGNTPAPPNVADIHAADREQASELAQRVDLGLLTAASTVLLEATEQALPALEAFATELIAVDPSPGLAAPASGACDLLELPGLVCVSGLGSGTWTNDYWLLIDLEGNDVYRNNQGAGSLASGIPVALLIDVLGDDRYVATDATATSSAEVIAQGAGVLGAGVLVDASGNDAYSAIATASPPPAAGATPSATTVAQGAGLLGAGALVDPLGQDLFEADASTLGASAITVAQGAGSLGAGALVTGTGVGEDGLPSVPSTYSATASSGILLVSEQKTSTSISRQYAIGAATTVAQGGGEAGAGALVDAIGSDTYTARSSGGATATIAQGGALVGAGALVDGEGSDTRTAIADSTATLNWVSTRVCPSGFVCGSSLTITVRMGSALTVAQGAGNLGLGLLADIGGVRNLNEASAFSRPTANAIIEFTGAGSPGELQATATVDAGDAEVNAHGSAPLGSGVLLGAAGTDTYRIRAISDARAAASIIGAEGSTTATALGGNSIGLGQGYAGLASAGVLADIAGNDAYEVIQSATASASAASSTAIPGSVLWSGRGHATGAGLGALVDLGGTDRYSAVPGPDYQGANDDCWTQSPPGITAQDPAIGMGVDSDAPFTSLLAPRCSPVPPN